MFRAVELGRGRLVVVALALGLALCVRVHVICPLKDEWVFALKPRPTLNDSLNKN